jgi:serine protease
MEKNSNRVWMPLDRSVRIILILSVVLMLSIAGCSGGGSSGDDGGDDASRSSNPPEAAFTVSTDIGSGPLAVVFDASGATGGSGVLRYGWDFGDGNSGDGVRASHTYEEVGVYTARLTVTDESDLTGTASHVIEVKPLYAIRGTMTPAEHLVSDSDVNDPNKRFDPGEDANDDFASAQEVCDSCVVSGYVNVAGTGEDGRSVDSGDPYDVYKVTLAGGTHVTLHMAEAPDLADLNLSLYDAGENLVDASLSGTSPEESVTVPEDPGDGVYFVEVSAEAAASAYILEIGSSGAAVSSSSLRLSDDFVPGEILVRFKTDAGEAVSNLAGNPGDVSPMGFFSRARDRGRDRLLRRSETVGKSRFFNRLGVRSALDRSLARGRVDAETRAKMETLWMVRAMEGQPGVVCAQPNYILKAFATEPDDPLYSRQWHYPLINLPDAWDVSTGSSDVTVAVIDTGVLSGHPDLDGQLVAGYDFVDGDDDPTDEDTLHHGTHVAGTVAAASDNGLGVAGVAWNAKVMPLRVLDANGSGNVADVLEAVKHAAGLDADGQCL